jgi:hypothetical protein
LLLCVDNDPPPLHPPYVNGKARKKSKIKPTHVFGFIEYLLFDMDDYASILSPKTEII